MMMMMMMILIPILILIMSRYEGQPKQLACSHAARKSSIALGLALLQLPQHCAIC